MNCNNQSKVHAALAHSIIKAEACKRQLSYFLKLPRTPGRGLEVSATWDACRSLSLDSSKGILGWRASWWICIDFMSGAVILQSGHSNLACPPFSCPDRSASPAFPPTSVCRRRVYLRCNLLSRVFFRLRLPRHTASPTLLSLDRQPARTLPPKLPALHFTFHTAAATYGSGGCFLDVVVSPGHSTD
ncbi:hypothetical protein HPP92_025656 [Vanilla planifolia]|uniref:Uncharacterized protein n=1 Tax=Vanilla planifolia TaxID=51239 RepID=A0A835PMQ2_VANPL|nr:hypothetical protein HPP92_025656 [Vanilla planifolia]